MHASPFAAPPLVGNGTGSRARPLRICVLAPAGCDPGIPDEWRRFLPPAARLAYFGAGVPATWGDIDRPDPTLDGSDAAAVLAAAAGAFRGEDLVLVRAGTSLPPFAIDRLLHALATADVLAALPLDDAARRPLPEGITLPDTEWLDALCFAFSDRRLVDDPSFPPARFPALSAWHGERLARIDASRPLDRDALDANGLRVVLLDHVYVAGARSVDAPPAGVDPRDLPPPLPWTRLRERVAVAVQAGCQPACPGLDRKPVLLHVLHGWGGGAERWVRDYAAADEAAHHLVLVARGSFARKRHGEWLALHDGRCLGDAPLCRFPLPRAIADTALGDATYRALLATILRRYCVDAVVVSSLIGHSLDALRTGLPTFCIVHDHYPLWPVLHRDFGDAALAFDEAQRARDLADGLAGEFANADPRHWRHLHDATVAALQEAHATLVAPSRSALANHLRLAPALATLPNRVIAHALAPWPDGTQALPAPPRRERLRLVVPGRIRRGKGAELLLAALPRLCDMAEVFLLGAGADAHDLFGTAGVHVVLDYRRDELPALLARIRPDAALLLPTVAETFSYMLSELRSLGVPVLATRRGALAERIREGVDGFLVDADADAVVAGVAALAGERARLAAVAAASAALPVATPGDMARAYTEVMQLGPRAPLRYAVEDGGGLQLAAEAAAAALAAAHVQADGLRTERDAARRESARRGEWGHALDRDLATTHAELDERTRWALDLDAQLAAIKPPYEQMLASTSWRLTAPLRAANARVRGLRAALAFRSARLRNLAGRTRGSLAQRGFAGTLARIGRELAGGHAGGKPTVYPPPRDDFAPFALPTSDTPVVSIVIPVYDKIAYTSACLRSIAAHAGDTPFEAIVVDDGSGDATPQRLADIAGLRVLRNPRNLGFIGSCNAGAAAARGEYVLFLNNDTLVTAGWLEALLRCLREAPAAGLVGARLVYPDGRLQESGGIVFADGSGWNVGRFGDPADPRYAFRREADYCSGAAILLARALFERLGRFDTRYTPAYYEDTDLAFAVRAAGLKVYVEPAATVIHFEGITSGTDTAGGTKRYQLVNQEKFVAKWREALAHQPAPGTPITRAATHRARHRVLVVDATTPTPDQDSGSLRMVNLMRLLGELGCQVSFLPENRLYVPRYTAALQALGVEALHAPLAQDPVKLLRERGREFDLVLLSRHYVATPFYGLVRLYAPQARLVFDTVDLHYLREQRAAELAGDAALARHAAATRAQELKLIREADVTLVVSPVERELLARDAPGARVEVLSNVHEVHGCRAPFATRRDLVFVGGFQHPPNADAVAWFVAEVFPAIRATLPDVRFHVIGSKVPAAIAQLAGNGVEIHGYVPDIQPSMDGCRVSVAPLRYGAGVKGKVNMAMSCGLPVVATPAAVEGMHVEPGREVLVASDAAGFADAVIRLYQDEALWNTLSAQGLANVQRHFSFDAARAALQRLLGEPGARG